jgi:hypothetical protein
MALARDRCVSLYDGQRKLEFLIRRFGLAESQPHRALPDARLTKEVFLRLVQAIPLSPIYSPDALSWVSQLFTNKRPPRFFAELPLSRLVPKSYEGLVASINEQQRVGLRLKGEGPATCRTLDVTPRWFTREGDNLVGYYHAEGMDVMFPVRQIEALDISTS